MIQRILTEVIFRHLRRRGHLPAQKKIRLPAPNLGSSLPLAIILYRLVMTTFKNLHGSQSDDRNLICMSAHVRWTSPHSTLKPIFFTP
ncbi:hypothetical protein CDAR_612261 [Caerostris darwini]|uniref:Uncharacterized protein n=1 Tax=Caerostris darwini TaxID=1538125 RepID=A0AAV4RZ73_9ARAC|nr:hypothetical protein CDAR_612261 [Caerostris darwini]